MYSGIISSLRRVAGEATNKIIMWYVYVLRSKKNQKMYTGVTSDLKKRFRDHNSKNGSKYTSKNAPFELIFYEAFLNKKNAYIDEVFFKSGYGREVLKGKLRNFLKII